MVQVRLDVLDAVGASMPRPAWTLAEFTGLCTVIAAALEKGVLARLGVEHVLFPLATKDLYGMAGGLEPMVLGAPGFTTLLWEAFIVGFGGDVASGGVVRWNEGAAYEGISELLAIASRFGGGAGPDPAEAGQTWAGSAMAFVLAEQLSPPHSTAATQLLPFPEMPMRPVIPASDVAEFVAYGTAQGGVHRLTPAIASAGARVDEAMVVQEAGDYFAWRLGDQAQKLFARAGIVPMTRNIFAADTAVLGYGLANATNEVWLESAWPKTPSAAAALQQLGPAVSAGLQGDQVAAKAALGAFSASMSAALGAAQSGGDIGAAG